MEKDEQIPIKMWKFYFWFNHSIVGHRHWALDDVASNRINKKKKEYLKILRDPFQINHTGESRKTTENSRTAKRSNNQTAPG